MTRHSKVRGGTLLVNIKMYVETMLAIYIYTHVYYNNNMAKQQAQLLSVPHVADNIKP